MLRIGSTVLGVEDVPRAVAFWCAALGYVPRDEVEETWAVLIPSDGRPGAHLSLGRSRTPVQSHPRVHLDLYAEDPENQIARLVELGATVVDWDRYPPDADFTVLADPDGNRFCVIDKSPARLATASPPEPAETADAALVNRLAVYGTLQPGHVNHHHLAGLDGRWFKGSLLGRLVDAGWGSARGYPAIVLDADGLAVAAHVLESDDLPAHWARLDAFEGDGYRRVVADVVTDDGVIRAHVYVLAEPEAEVQ